MNPVVALTIIVIFLATALIVQGLRHVKIEQALLDRVLEASGNRPIESEPVEKAKRAEVPPRKLMFPLGQAARVK